MRSLLIPFLSLLLLLSPSPLRAQESPSQPADLAKAIKAAIESAVPGVKVDAGQETTNTYGDGKGASLKGGADEVAAQFNASSPEAAAGAASAKGGTTEAKVKAESSLLNKWELWLGLALLGAAYYFRFRHRNPDGTLGNAHLALVSAIAGGGLIFYAVNPVGFWILAVCSVLLAIGYVYLSVVSPISLAKIGKVATAAESQYRRADEALRAVVGGVAETPDHVDVTVGDKTVTVPVAAAVKAEIAKQADPADEATIREIKDRDRLVERRK